MTPEKVRELLEAEHHIHEARLAFAETVRRLGISACARALGITPSALGERIHRIEAAKRTEES